MKLRFLKKNRLKPSDRVRSLISAADRHRDARHWALAKESYAEALRMDATLSHIWVQYGHSLKESGNPAEALRAYKAAYDLKSTEADTALQIAHCVKILGDLEKAKSWYLRAFELDVFDIRAERELKFLNVPVELYIPDLEKRRAKLKAFSLDGRPFFFCILSEEYGSVGSMSASRHACLLAMLRREAKESNIGICEISPTGALAAWRSEDGKFTASSLRDEVPEGAVLILTIDALMDCKGIEAVLLQVAQERSVIPIMFVDKLLNRKTARSLVEANQQKYLSARSTSFLTLALDEKSVATLDDVASALNYSLPPVVEVKSLSGSISDFRAGSGDVVIVCRDPRSSKILNVLSCLDRDQKHNTVLAFEDFAGGLEKGSLFDTRTTCGARSQDGISAIQNALVVILMDDCVDVHLWVRTARERHRPVITGLLGNVAQIWGSEIIDYVDFANERSIDRIPQHIVALKASDGEELEDNASTAPKLYNWEELSSFSWSGRDGFAPFQLGEFYAFMNESSLHYMRNYQSAERFRYGPSWMQTALSLDQDEKEWVLAGRVSERESNFPVLRLLIRNESENVSVLRWTSPHGQETAHLPSGRQIWVNLLGEYRDNDNGLFFFKWRGETRGSHPLGFVLTSSDKDASWSGFLDDVQKGRHQHFL